MHNTFHTFDTGMLEVIAVTYDVLYSYKIDSTKEFSRTALLRLCRVEFSFM